MNERQEPKTHDVIIIGGGPAGLTAAIYTARDKLSTLLIEKGITGGLITETERLDNYPGFPEGISGLDLTSKMLEQAVKYGPEIAGAEVTAVEVKGNKSFTIKTSEGDYAAKAVIIASGSDKQRLGVPGEREFTGKGVAYCATCDAPFYKDKVVAVVGGGNAAVYEALHLAKFASKVYLIHRRAELRATPVVQEQAREEPKIEYLWNTVVEAVEGQEFVETLKLKDIQTGRQSRLRVEGVFVALGLKPKTDYLKGTLELDEQGMIVVSNRMETSVPGIFAAGDIRHGSILQAIAAAGDGAIAAVSAKKWLDEG